MRGCAASPQRTRATAAARPAECVAEVRDRGRDSGVDDLQPRRERFRFSRSSRWFSRLKAKAFQRAARLAASAARARTDAQHRHVGRRTAGGRRGSSWTAATQSEGSEAGRPRASLALTIAIVRIGSQLRDFAASRNAWLHFGVGDPVSSHPHCPSPGCSRRTLLQRQARFQWPNPTGEQGMSARRRRGERFTAAVPRRLRASFAHTILCRGRMADQDGP